MNIDKYAINCQKRPVKYLSKYSKRVKTFDAVEKLENEGLKALEVLKNRPAEPWKKLAVEIGAELYSVYSKRWLAVKVWLYVSAHIWS